MPPAHFRGWPLASPGPASVESRSHGAWLTADAKVKELEQDAYDGRRPSFSDAGPPLHDEPGAYVPQVP